MTQTSPAGSSAESTAELIALGRDREAVDAATRDSAQRTNEGGTMDGVQQLDELMPLLEAVVDGIQPDQLDASTPCAKYTVTGVMEHMIAGSYAFGPSFRGDAPEEPPTDGTVHERWHDAMKALTAAMHSEGAQERTVTAPFGQVPGAMFARFVVFDGMVHGWDMAVSTGQAYAPRDELVTEVEAFARQALQPEMRDGDLFAAQAPVPDGATSIERLAAFSGRSIPT